jgi:hypothetical protein
MINVRETLDSLKAFRDDAQELMEGREIVSFNIAQIDIDNSRMSYGGMYLSENATKKVLSQLRVKNNFLSLSEEMGPTDWGIIKDKLKRVQADQVIHGRKIDNEGIFSIDDIYMAAPKASGVMEIDTVFNEISESIITTTKDLGIEHTTVLEDKDEIHVTLVEHDSPIDVFSNGSDVWKRGKRIVWNGICFSVLPVFMNGKGSINIAPRHGFRSNISNNKFNLDKIKSVLEKEVTMVSDTLDSNLIDSVNHLKHYNISVREFATYKKFFNEALHSEILKKWFNDTKINKAYGCVAVEMPALWQVTADTGINAYDFFNDLTYIASHPEDAKLTERERFELQIKATDLLFKRELDMELVAPKVKWS